VVTNSLSAYTEKYEESVREGGGPGWLGTITSMVGNIFLQEDTGLRYRYRDPNSHRLNFFLLSLI
jgi:hypothetical protein